MQYLLISFIAGILTVLAPCVFPMLPIILGGSLGSKSLYRPFVVILSLALSIVSFTLLLKVFFIGVPQSAMKTLSAGIIVFFGITMIFPELWDKISAKLGLGSSSQKALQNSAKKEGILGWILLGASLGPVFSACSPTYFLIVGTVLPQNFFIGLLNLLVYALGLFIILFAITIFGRKITAKMKGLTDSKGYFKKILGIIFILLGLTIYLGYDKVFEAWLLDFKFFETLSSVENSFIE